MTKLIRSMTQITDAHRGSVVTIGNFDGVHLGHRQLLERMLEKARSLNAPTLVITFEPQPHEFFAGDKSAARLSRWREKFVALSSYAIDYIMILKFDEKLAAKTAGAFIDEILYKKLAPSHVIIGDDFRFGFQRAGDFSLLQQVGAELGFSVEAMPTFILDDERVSSTRIRKALSQGQLALAKKLLGRPYSMVGRVRRGEQLGRKLGIPTANLLLHRKKSPLHGIYTVYVHGLVDQPLPAVASIGTRPTVDGREMLLEVHLLDFDQEIYGRYVKVEFCEKLRDEICYPNLEMLKAQMVEDVTNARNYFQDRAYDE